MGIMSKIFHKQAINYSSAHKKSASFYIYCFTALYNNKIRFAPLHFDFQFFRHSPQTIKPIDTFVSVWEYTQGEINRGREKNRL